MASEWLKNVGGISRTDEQMESIPNATRELCIHVTTKAAELFGLFGTCVVGPTAAAIIKDNRNLAGIKMTITRAGRGGLIFGTFSGPLIMYMSIRKDTDDYQVWDRCYRLRHNNNQIRFDQFSIMGSIFGAGISAAAGSGAMFGGLMGMSSGILLTAVYNYGKVITKQLF